MKVSILIFGRFHAFNLAQELFKRNVLKKLYTTFPFYGVKRFVLLNRKFVSSQVVFEVIWRIIRKINVPWLVKKTNFYLKLMNDYIVSLCIDTSIDVFIGWSNHSLITIRKCKKHNIITILERGSAHILEQKDILNKEYAKLMMPFSFSEDHIQRELIEYELVDYVSIPSVFVRDSFIKHGVPKEKLLLNPYGVDLSSFKPVKKKDDVFRFIFVGNLSIRKGAHYLLQAFNELELNDTEFWHIGNVPFEMESFIKKYNMSNIRFFGNQPQDQLYYYYSQCNVFILPSLEEGFGMVIPQAMACGLPVICTFNTGGSTIVENNQEGFIVPVADVESLKEKMMWFYSHPLERKKMGENAQSKVSSGLTWDDYGKRYINNLNKIYESKKTV